MYGYNIMIIGVTALLHTEKKVDWAIKQVFFSFCFRFIIWVLRKPHQKC